MTPIEIIAAALCVFAVYTGFRLWILRFYIRTLVDRLEQLEGRNRDFRRDVSQLGDALFGIAKAAGLKRTPPIDSERG